MKAVAQDRFGGPGELAVRDLADPEPGPGEVLIRVRAASVNPVDVKTRAGRGVAGRLGPNPFPLVLGWDVAGEVIGHGPGVHAFDVGERVFGLARFPSVAGAYAELAAVPVHDLAAIPPGVDDAHAAAAPLAALTAWQALVEAARVRPAQRVAITAAAGGVGHLAIQLAVALGAEVTAITSAAGRDVVERLGAHHVLSRDDGDWARRGVFDVIVDGAQTDETLRAASRALADDGLLVTLPSPPPDRPPGDVHMVWTLVRPDARHLEQIAARLADGSLRVHVARCLDLADAAEAHRFSETGTVRGKLVLRP